VKAIETEIKFRVADRAGLESRLDENGFHLETPSTFESNTLYDTSERTLRARHELVRIRKYGERWVLTHKRVPDDGVGEDRHKHRVETETEVTDGAALVEVFRALGLAPVFTYEKRRTEWADGEGHCVIDETPIGVFAELEGAPAWIDRRCVELGVAEEDRLILSYGRLFELWKQASGSSARDLTFDAISSSGS
jgi:adenylate cyclase, class 2